MSWRPDVIADGSGQWAWNALRFATQEEALRYAENLASRWTAVRAIRVTAVSDPVNAAFHDHTLAHFTTGETQ
jgi:hypothetical protein